MATLTIRVSGLEQALEEDLAPGEGVIIGRSPDPRNIPPSAVPGKPIRWRTLPVVTSTISTQHALAWNDGGTLHVRDLHSRNGTSVQLTGGGAVATAGPVDQLELHLARVDAATRSSRPQDATWGTPAEFPEAVVREVNRWLAGDGVQGLRLALEPADAPRQGALFPPIPLTPEWRLRAEGVRAGSTIDTRTLDVIETLVAYVHDQRAQLSDDADDAHGGDFVMASPAFRKAHQRVVEAAERGLPMIVLGPTGAGKGTLARCYHTHSRRRDRPFEQVNCAEIDKHFARTRLFGAKKGAYTGCVADIAGAVECAHGGTLFLDELIELPMDVQGELLTFLDGQRYKRFGDDVWRTADVRLVCGTNADLREAVRTGRFRADLWYRVAGRIVEIPGLRARPEDVAAYLRARSLEERADALSVYDALDEKARALLLREHDWSGNFRELDNFIRRLPPVAKPGGLSAALCRELLGEGSLRAQAGADGAAGARPGGAPSSSWDELHALASQAYQQRAKTEAPQRANEFRDYVEEVLKPMFFARVLGMEHLSEVPERPTPGWEELARKAGCDSATVKSQLARYVALKGAGAKPGRT